MALETHRLDKLEETINNSQDRASILVYALRVCQDLVVHKGFRQEVQPFSFPQSSITYCYSTGFSSFQKRPCRSTNASCTTPSRGNLTAYFGLLASCYLAGKQLVSPMTSRCCAQVLRLLVRLYKSVSEPDYLSISQCLAFLDDAAEVAKLLDGLLKGSEVCKARLEPGLLQIRGEEVLPGILSSFCSSHASTDPLLR